MLFSGISRGHSGRVWRWRENRGTLFLDSREKRKEHLGRNGVVRIKDWEGDSGEGVVFEKIWMAGREIRAQQFP